MRIAYVCQTYPPMVNGAAVAVHHLAEGMSRRGHAVLVLTASDTGRTYERSDGRLRIKLLASVSNPLRVGQRMTFLPRGAVMRELGSFQPQIVHSHEPLGVGLTCIRVARSSGIPVVLTVHQLPWFIAAHVPDYPGLRPAVEELMWSYADWVVGQCDRLVAPTLPIGRRLQERVDRLPEVISSGVDSDVFAPQATSAAESSALRSEFGLDPDLPVILYVGRLDPDKRVEQVVQASARALASTPAQLLIVGDGTRRPAVERLCERLGIADRTRFTGYVRRDEQLPGVYRLASVLITVSAIETQCLVALEALLSGVPVVTVDTPVMRELVHHGVNGFLVRPDDLDLMASRLVFLLQNPGVAQGMGRAGRELAQRHSPECMLDRHERLYRSVLTELESQRAPVSTGRDPAAGQATGRGDGVSG